MGTELTIPRSAYDKADEIAGRYPSDREAAAHIAAEVMAAVAPLIVAAELQRLADELQAEENSHRIWRAISRRASELRGEAKQ